MSGPDAEAALAAHRRAMRARFRLRWRAAVELAGALLGELGLTAASADRAAREAVIEALKLLAPESGEIVMRGVGRPFRVWRDAAGAAQAEEIDESRAAGPAPPPPGSAPPRPPRPERPGPIEPDPEEEAAAPPAAPQATEPEAEALGREAGGAGAPITANPFPPGRLRARWDAGWRAATGSDGMGPDDDDEGGA